MIVIVGVVVGLIVLGTWYFGVGLLVSCLIIVVRLCLVDLCGLI